MTQNSNLYFIAIVPPISICREINIFKLDFADRFASKKTLNVVPHITLKIPFRLPAKEHDHLLAWFRNIKLKEKRFNIELKDFNVFPGSRKPVIFIQPLANDTMIELQKGVLQSFSNEFPKQSIEADKNFHPHITVGYRDLARPMFKAAWVEYSYKKYEASFEINALHLLLHDGKEWNIIESHSIK